MRIMIVSTEFPPGPGGIGTHAWQVARYLVSQNIPVMVLTPQDYASSAEIAAFNQAQPFTVKSMGPTRNFLAKALSRSQVFREAIREFQPDLVMASGARSIWLSAFMLSSTRVPWVAVGHGTEFGTNSGIAAQITRFSSKKAAGMICVSGYTRKMVEMLGIDKPMMIIIHNGADQKQFYIQDPRTVDHFRLVNGVDGKFVLLTVGNVSDRKGQEFVIRALPAIVEKHPDLVYWLAGLPTKRDHLQQLALDLGVGDHIRFWGRVDQQNLLNLYNACDLFVMTSQQLRNGDFEGYGIAVIEAALCGKTSLVTDNSGLAEAVQDEVTGLLVPQGEVQPIMDAVNRLVESPGLLRSLSAAAQFRALQEQTWDQVGKQYLDFFSRVLLKR